VAREWSVHQTERLGMALSHRMEMKGMRLSDMQSDVVRECAVRDGMRRKAGLLIDWRVRQCVVSVGRNTDIPCSRSS
jgi:hypothetical protein